MGIRAGQLWMQDKACLQEDDLVLHGPGKHGWRRDFLKVDTGRKM